MFTWIKNKYLSFEQWCASWAPGFKTHIVAGLGMLGSLAGALQEYFTNVPLTTFVTIQTAGFITAGLFALVIIARHLANVVPSVYTTNS